MSTSSTIVNGKKDGTTQSDRGTFGRYVETPVDRMSPEMLDAFGGVPVKGRDSI
jgi:hypothetical protein